jgi:hypothetical protein
MTPRASRSPRSTVATPPFVPPYRPSWFDRLTTAIDRLPGPYWVPYLAAFLASLGLEWLVVGRVGESVSSGQAFTISLPFYGFWLIHYLNRRAASSLRVFRSAFTGSESELEEVHWRLTTLPAMPALVISLLGLVLGVASSLDWNPGAPDQVLSNLAYYATTVFAGLYAYHAVRQLRLVTSLYAGRARVDIHNVAPLYSFSILSAHTAIGMLLVLSGAVLITPEGLVEGFLLAALLFGALAVLTFLLPLAGLHRRLAEEKDLALAENGVRWQSSTAELYRRVDRRDWAGADRLNATLTALERGRAAIDRIPTWPWRPETLRGLVAALVLPVAIWLVQYGLERILQ